MNLFIGITSCQHFEDKGHNDHCRETWLKGCGVDYRFFIGKTPVDNPPDVIVLNCGDDYASLCYKNYEKFSWAFNSGYDYMYNADTDTYACVERLLSSGFENFDYFGDFYHEEPRQPYPHSSYGTFCQEGPGYFISRKALDFCIKDLPEKFAQGNTDFDPLVGEVCRKYRDRGELVIGDGSWRRFVTHWDEHDPGPRKNNDILSCHLSTLPPNKNSWFETRRMYKLYNEWLNL